MPGCSPAPAVQTTGLQLLRLASHLDLRNLNNTTARGLHIATMGGLWQALAFGFGGLRVANGVLTIHPRLPARWSQLGLRVRVGPARVHLRLRPDAVDVSCDAPVTVRLPDGGAHQVTSGGIHFIRTTSGATVDGRST